MIDEWNRAVKFASLFASSSRVPIFGRIWWLVAFVGVEKVLVVAVKALFVGLLTRMHKTPPAKVNILMVVFVAQRSSRRAWERTNRLFAVIRFDIIPAFSIQINLESIYSVDLSNTVNNTNGLVPGFSDARHWLNDWAVGSDCTMVWRRVSCRPRLSPAWTLYLPLSYWIESLALWRIMPKLISLAFFLLLSFFSLY